MIRVAVSSHKDDGDHLIVNWAPWWLTVYEFLVHRVTPCCGVAGWISHWEWGGDKIYTLANRLMIWGDRFEKERFKTPIPHACVASQEIWPDPGWDWCWRDDCPVHHPEEPE